MSIPYRTQQKLKRFAISLVILLVVAVIVWGMWVLWLQRFVVYTRDNGAVIDFAQPQTLPAGELAETPREAAIEIYYNEGDNKINTGLELGQLNGYYVTRSELTEDPNGTWDRIQALPSNTAVMLDLKDIYGTFYYSTNTGRPKIDRTKASAVDTLIRNLKDSSYYTIARVPALRDLEFGLDSTSNGLPVEGGYLWPDEYGCYWLDPTKEGTVTYLMNIAKELQALGFDEVVFEDFYFPKTDEIVFTGDKKKALETAAQTLVTNCATNTFAVSFVSDGSWTAPTGRSRTYRDDISNPVELLATVDQITIEQPEIYLVFVTSNLDERFDNYGVLRPLEQRH